MFYLTALLIYCIIIFLFFGGIWVLRFFPIADNQKSSGKAEQKSFKQAGMINFFKEVLASMPPLRRPQPSY